MLVLNNLPNVQILNGRSTKDEEEDEEEEERESNENEDSENMEKNKNNHFFSKLEEIEEDKNMENNSNYVSNENNNLNTLKDIMTSNKNKTNGNDFNNNTYNKGNTNIPKLNLNEKKDVDNINNDTEGKTNSLLYDKIISNRENNIKRETFSDLKNDTKTINNGNYIIDITNEELNLLKDEKYDRNYDFINFLKEFSDIFNNEEKDEENKIINI